MEPPRNLITRILEAAFMLALAAFLIKTAVGWILEIWPVLFAIAMVIAVIIVIYRIWKHKHDKDLGQW
ncbi:hypothetical protein [Mediterraneibacter agrestimuris]|uniref:hypothetical protein n=1 Tax=Mediterraneibacter agrestimuris TaxID=2941333 RepID=UPI00203D817B|nr:hypothetical protein [Mediterraneibacter agrestimuris]